MIVLYVYTPVQQNNNIFLLISLNPTLVVCRKKSVCLSLFLCLSHSRFFFFSLATRYDYSWLFLQHARKEKSKRRSRGTLVPKIVTCSRAFDHFLLYKKKGRRRKTGGRGTFFHTSRLIYYFKILLVLFYLVFFVFFVTLSREARHTFKVFKGKKSGMTAEEEQRRGSFVSRNFFLVFFFVF